MTKTTLLLGGALLALCSSAMGAKFYKWQDEDGVTHYGSQAPSERQSDTVRTYNSSSSSQPAALERLEKQRQQAADERQQAQEAAREAAAERGEDPALSKERCDQHRDNLKTLTNKPTVRVENPDTGEMEVIDQARRDKMLQETRDALKRCQ